jgi:DNA topoisomerase I
MTRVDTFDRVSSRRRPGTGCPPKRVLAPSGRSVRPVRGNQAPIETPDAPAGRDEAVDVGASASLPRATPLTGAGSDPAAAAEAASLHYVSDSAPGFRRLRAGRGFRYLASDGSALRDLAARRRIRSLAIPPAWTDVWICSSSEGHIQAVGRDSRGRKQYRYHARWREVRDATKYARMAAFAAKLPKIRRRVCRDLARPGLSREKILATVVRLLETSLIRVGNAEYAETNGSFGLTTLRTRHVTIEGASLRFVFRGKGGKRHVVDVSDRRLARIVGQCQELPGHELFQYADGDGHGRPIGSADVNAYLREISGEEFTAKDFRTWAGTLLTARFLRDGDRNPEPNPKRRIARAIEAVAARLGNTAAICRKCYVHPGIIDAHLDGTLRRISTRATRGKPGLAPEEAAIVPLLRTRKFRHRADSGARLARGRARRAARS